MIDIKMSDAATKIVTPTARDTYHTSNTSAGMSTHHGMRPNACSEPLRIQLKGCVSGSRTIFRLSLMARKPFSIPVVMSRVLPIARHALWRLSSEGNGTSHQGPAAVLPWLRLIRSCIDTGSDTPPALHQERNPRWSNHAL